MAKISVIEGVGKTYEETLRAHGLRSVEKYLLACSNSAQRAWNYNDSDSVAL